MKHVQEIVIEVSAWWALEHSLEQLKHYIIWHTQKNGLFQLEIQHYQETVLSLFV